MTRRCITCQRPFPADAKHFARRRDRSDGLDPRCKECLRESVKLSMRVQKQMPRFERLIRTWPDQQIESEIEYLLEKLMLLREQERKRALSRWRKR